MDRRNRTQRGFTLVEIMVVVVIIGLLATAVAQYVFGDVDRARLEKVKSDISAIVSAAERYRLNNTRPPESIEELIGEDEGGNRYLKLDEVPKDPWENEYALEPDERGRDVIVVCLGPDGQLDTDDDITSKNMHKIKKLGGPADN